MRYFTIVFVTLLITTLLWLSSCGPSTQTQPTNSHPDVLNVLDYGANPDGKTLCTEAFQQALDAATNNGGGHVRVPAGNYLLGTIFIKSNTIFELTAGATLLGSPNIEDYTTMTWGHNKDRQPWHLVVIKDAENVEIRGTGIIDGQGENYWKEYEKDENGDPKPRWIMAKDKKVSPLVEVQDSRKITIRDVEMRTGGGWNLHIYDSDVVNIDGVRIINNLFSPNSDGIDITGGRDVTVSNCYIHTCDDGVCLKTTYDSRTCERVTVTNCVIITSCVALKLGATESFKDIKDVTFSNCVIDKSNRALGWYVREGGTFENITVSNIVCNTRAPFVLNRPIHIMVQRKHDTTALGYIRNVSISNFVARTEGRILITSPEPGHIENLTLRDVHLEYPYIEDPTPYSKGITSGQYPRQKDNPEARTANAAIVAANVDGLIIDNVTTKWPGDTIPQNWQLPERIENGGFRVFTPEYNNPRPVEFSVLWGKNLRGGYVRMPVATPSAPNKQLIETTGNSTIKVLE